MGKKQHQKDKLYLTCTEWTNLYGGKSSTSKKEQADFKRLPFFCCSLSFQPFEHPLCTKNGVIFDLMSIVPFLKQYGVDPVTGEKISAKDLIKLNFFKNAQDKYHCPVTYKVFNENTHIVAVKTTGNVFAYDAIEKLNIKPKHWKDLLTDEPFTRNDLITIQDPTHLDKFNLTMFYHLKHNLKVIDEDEEKAKKDPMYRLKSVNNETKDILKELESTYQAPEKQEDVKLKPDKFNAAHYSTGRVAASFTSTAVDRSNLQEAAIIDESILLYERIKKKGYVRILTNKGMLNIELHCDMVPRTCQNFLKLCQQKYYNGTVFHRSIRNFMIQGGDPEGTGTGGQSIWGKPFNDEFKPNLTHTGRGILSMANSGKDTNKSQFFITYRSCRHLDNKHSVFGRVVGGLDTVDKMEAVKADKNDRPEDDIKIEDTMVFSDPYEEAEEQLAKERADATKKEEEERQALSRRVVKPSSSTPTVFKAGVGKYINSPALKRETKDTEQEAPKKKKSKASGGFGNFSAW